MYNLDNNTSESSYIYKGSATINHINWNEYATIGVDQLASGSNMLGTIDMNNSYIKVNGEYFYMQEVSY